MQIELSPEQISFVDLGIQEGRFRNPEEAIQLALALWVNRERARIELLASIEAGDSSSRAEDIVLESEEDIAKFFAGVKQRGLAKLANTKSVAV